jgi:hypothetical protein
MIEPAKNTPTSGDRPARGRWHRRGHPIVKYADGRWRWAATGRWLRLGSNPQDPPCTHCGLPPTGQGHDPCLGHLPDVRSACCGHGVVTGYIAYTNGTRTTLPLGTTDADRPPA